MFSTLMSFRALFLAVLMFLLCNSVLNTQLGLRMTLEGFSSLLTGTIMTCYFAGLFTGYFLCMHLIRQVGHIRSFSAFAAIATCISLLYGLHVSPFFWALLRFIHGIIVFGLFMVIESWLNECSDLSNRGRVFSVYMILCYIGIGTGQQLVNLDDAGGQNLFLIAAILASMSLVPVALTRSIHPKLPETGQYSFKSLFKKAPIGMLGCISAGLVNSAFYGIMPVFGLKIGLSVFEVSWLMSATVFGGLAVQWVLGIVSDHFDRTSLLLGVSTAMAIGCILIMFHAQTGFTVLLVEMGILGSLMFAIYPLSVARTHDVFGGTDTVAVSSALLLCYGIGAVFGPILASAIMTGINRPYGLFMFWILVSALFALGIVHLRKRERIKLISRDDQVEFVPMNNGSQVAMVLDPRSDFEDNTNPP